MTGYVAPTLCEIMDSNAAWYGAKPALVFGDRVIGYRQYLDDSRRLASALRRLGMKPQDRLGMLGLNSYPYCLFYGACAVAGFIASTVNFRLAPPEVEYVVSNSSQKVLIFDAAHTAQIDGIRQRLASVEHFVAVGGTAPDWAISFDDLLATGDPADPALRKPGPSDVAFLIYTSGTTGRPKGVMLEHAAVLERSRLVALALQLGPQDRLLIMMPLFHIGASAVQLAAHWRGATVHVHARFDALEIFRTIERERITAIHMAPTMIQMLLDDPRIDDFDLSSLKSVLYSAAAMPVSVLRRALDRFGPIFVQAYGQTEGGSTVLPAAVHVVSDDPVARRRLGSIGHPAPGTRFRIVDDAGTELSPGQVGEICYQGLGMMRGYWNNSAATIEAMRDGWLHMGDLGYRDEDGFFYLVDRKKDMIISGGENIYSREVEDALLEHPAVAEAAVIGVPDPKWGETVCAVLVLERGQTIDLDTLRHHCRALIASYKLPRIVHVVAELPKNVNGKVEKQTLRATYGQLADPL